MSTIPEELPVSVEEYLRGEETARNKHEYLDGYVYAMTGASADQNRIVRNVISSLDGQLEGKPCEVFPSDMKVRIQSGHRTWFYYPDVSVVCQPNPRDEMFQDKPVVIVEVLSKSTRRIDEYEKRDGYLSIESLKAYVLVEQASAKAVVHRRHDQGFIAEIYRGLDQVIPLTEIGSELSMARLYRGVEFGPVLADGELENEFGELENEL